MEGKDLYTTQEVAELIGITAGRIRQLIMLRRFTPKRKIGGTWVFTPDEIEQLRTRQKPKGGRPKKQ
jgi:DNA-binding transcriptional MerR regulator